MLDLHLFEVVLLFVIITIQQVRVRIGSPITGYGSESRNRAARQRIPNKTWTDEDGVEHIVVSKIYPILMLLYVILK